MFGENKDWERNERNGIDVRYKKSLKVDVEKEDKRKLPAHCQSVNIRDKERMEEEGGHL